MYAIRSYYVRHLFDEQRNAIGLLCHLCDYFGRQGSLRRDRRDHRLDVGAVQAAEGELGQMRAHRPGGLELRARREEQEQAGRRDLVDEEGEQVSYNFV